MSTLTLLREADRGMSRRKIRLTTEGWTSDHRGRLHRVTTSHERAADEVTVEMVCSALNHVEADIVSGSVPSPSEVVLGSDGAGIVIELGSGTSRFSVGDEVIINPAIGCAKCAACRRGESSWCESLEILGVHRHGTHSRFVTVPERNLVPRPLSRSWIESAAFGLGTLTAVNVLRRTRLQPGDELLVVGASGDVGRSCLAVATAMGVAEISCTSLSETKHSELRRYGAKRIYARAPRQPLFDVAVDGLGQASLPTTLLSLKQGGRLGVYGALTGNSLDLDVTSIFFKQHEMIGVTLGSYSDFDLAAAMLKEGMPVAIDSTFDLESYPDALSRLGAPDRFGKVVMIHSPERAAQ